MNAKERQDASKDVTDVLSTAQDYYQYTRCTGPVDAHARGRGERDSISR
jgi:hypothetical protein